MTPRSTRIALACGALAAALAAAALAQGQQVYRYVDKDGRVVYSDRAPPPEAKDVQAKRVTPNTIQNNETSLVTRQAQERFPVTLYTFACGEFCQSAEALLNRRGVPFATVNVEDPKGAERLQKLTGELKAPVLQVGDKLVANGYNEARWNALLDEAGYPKTPPSRRATPLKPAETPAAPTGAATPPAPPAQRSEAAPSTPPAGNYPKD